MFVAAVVRNDVHDHSQPTRTSSVNKQVEVRQRTEPWVDVARVRDVVAMVTHRRRIERREPKPVDAEVDQMVEPVGYAAKVADTVAVRVRVATDVDLVEDGSTPPGRVGNWHRARVRPRSAECSEVRRVIRAVPQPP